MTDPRDNDVLIDDESRTLHVDLIVALTRRHHELSRVLLAMSPDDRSYQPLFFALASVDADLRSVRLEGRSRVPPRVRKEDA